MKILICGDRYWNDAKLIRRFLISSIKYLHCIQTKSLDFIYDPDNIYIIEGEATGVDLIGKQEALNIGIPDKNILKFPAPWGDIKGKCHNQIGYNRSTDSYYWKGAGPYRNKLMIEQNPDLVLAFHNNISKSRGTKNMISLAESHNVERIIVENGIMITTIEKSYISYFFTNQQGYKYLNWRGK